MLDVKLHVDVNRFYHFYYIFFLMTIIRKLSALVCHHDEMTLHRITKLLHSNFYVKKCDCLETMLDTLTEGKFDIVIAGMTENEMEVIDLVKLHRFMYPEDTNTRFYLYAIKSEISDQEVMLGMSDARIDGVISNVVELNEMLAIG